MKGARPVVEDTAGAPGQGATIVASFAGTENPRHLRALAALLRRPVPREQLDREAGAANGPALVAELRARGLDLPCDRAPVLDRDGREVRRGVYALTGRDRIRIARWLARRERGEA
jgi:hypothetical protein